MAMKIINAQMFTQEYDLGNIPIDKSRKTAVLLRQSKKKADKDHYESRLLQESLIPIAMKLREEIDMANILVYDEGAGTLGTKGYDQRPELAKLYIYIANRIIGISLQNSKTTTN